MTTLDIGYAKQQLSDAAAAVMGDKSTLTTEEQTKVNSLIDAVKILDQVATATLSGVDMSNVQISANGNLVTKRRADTQDVYVGSTANTPTRTAANLGSDFRAGRLAADLFGPAPKSTTFKSIGHVAWAIQNGSPDVRMLSGASTGVPSDGGYLIPQEQVHQMLDAGLEDEIVRPRARVEGVRFSNKIISTFDGSTHASGNISGLHLQWVSEGGEMDYQIPKSRQIQLIPKKSYILVPATSELLADSPDFGSGLAPLMRSALSFGLDRTFLATGTGAGQPISVLSAASTIQVDKETSQSAATIVYENLTAMLARLHPACYRNAIWLFHQTCLPQLLQLGIPVGVGGDVVPVMTGTNGQYSILGRPAYFTEKLNALGSFGDCMLVDLSQYVVALQKDGFRLDSSSHLLFKTDETVFRLIVRVDGQPMWAQAMQPLNSAPTLSWAVTLQART